MGLSDVFRLVRANIGGLQLVDITPDHGVRARVRQLKTTVKPVYNEVKKTLWEPVQKFVLEQIFVRLRYIQLRYKRVLL